MMLGEQVKGNNCKAVCHGNGLNKLFPRQSSTIFLFSPQAVYPDGSLAGF